MEARLMLTAKTEVAYSAAARLPCSLPMGNMQVDIDPDFIGLIDPTEYVETSPANSNNRADERASMQHWRL
jgi:hypothetical protein